MTENHAKTIFDEIVASRAQKPLVVFDLDSTLFDVSPRSQRILRDFVESPEMRGRFPAETELLQKLKIEPADWGIREAIIRSGLRSTDEFYKTIRDFWRSRFFSSEFLHVDRPYRGAIEYVQRLAREGIEILYLTGRDEPNMKRGTLEALRSWGLPLTDDAGNLIMKPLKGSVEDEDFKADRLRELMARSSLIWFFENEPLIIEKILSASLNIKIVWIDTTHSGKAQPPVGLPVILQDGWEI